MRERLQYREFVPEHPDEISQGVQAEPEAAVLALAVEWCVLLRWDVHDTPPVPRVGDSGNTVVSVRTVPTLRVVHYPQFPSCM